jgi:hypothetical protein
MKGHHVDIWSEKEVVSYLNDLTQKGSVKKCSKLKLEKGFLNAYYPRCMGNHASREEAHNVKTSSKGDSAPRQYAWPVCPEVCPFFEETTDFASSSLAKQKEEQIVDKEPSAIPGKESSIIPEMVDVPMIQRSEEKETLEPARAPKEVDGTSQRIDQTIPEMQIKKLKRSSKKAGSPVLEPRRDLREGHHIDIWSEKEVVSYLNDLTQKGSVKKCSKLKLEKGFLNAYYPRCMGNHASREEAHNVKTSSKGDSAPRQYAWPVCPEVCPFFEEATDFASSLFAKQIEERIIDKEPSPIPPVAVVPIIQKHEEEKILEPQEILKRDDEITRMVDQQVSEVQVKKLKKLSRKTGLPVSDHIQRAIDEYLSKQDPGNK